MQIPNHPFLLPLGPQISLSITLELSSPKKKIAIMKIKELVWHKLLLVI